MLLTDVYYIIIVRLFTAGYFSMPSIFNIFLPKKMVGIDVGTFAVKIVEISRWGGQKTLENYGQIKSEDLYKEFTPTPQNPNAALSDEARVQAIKAILQEAGIKTKAVVFSIPDFSTFCTSFDIPHMPAKEIADAIRYNASQYIPLPMSEVTLDWHIIPSAPGVKTSSLKVFLVAVPNQVVAEYQSMAKILGLELYALEAEVLGIVRALAKNSPQKKLGSVPKATCLVDIGMQTSTINIIDGGFLKKSYSFNFNTSQLSHVVSTGLGVDLGHAEDIKSNQGMVYSHQDIVRTLYLLVDPLLVEIKNICGEFFQSEQKQIDQIYLTGGTANLPGLRDYMSENLKKEVLVPNCFSNFLYPPILDQTLVQLAPSFSAAVGVALGGLGL